MIGVGVGDVLAEGANCVADCGEIWIIYVLLSNIYET
jgi:hypothetical protein